MLRELPPELGPNTVAILEGNAFMYSEATGDVPRGSIGGLLFADTRFLDCWRLTLNGSSLLVLDSAPVQPYAAAFFLTNPDLPGLRANSVGVRRERLVGRGMQESIGSMPRTARAFALNTRTDRSRPLCRCWSNRQPNGWKAMTWSGTCTWSPARSGAAT
ncbi:hypothetical protein GCM10023176_34560 [Micromonospora coerulea]|uniref:Putative glycogen debranching enzyme N-terminal domain-containing protein n=1 Tax=Micromonospora coerulea TaxID=47856 RepID=A0ABP8SPY0_9ACTN